MANEDSMYEFQMTPDSHRTRTPDSRSTQFDFQAAPDTTASDQSRNYTPESVEMGTHSIFARF